MLVALGEQHTDICTKCGEHTDVHENIWCDYSNIMCPIPDDKNCRTCKLVDNE